MNIEHFILARGSSIDREGNSLSIFDLIEDIDVHSNAPGIAIPVQAIIVLKRKQGEKGELLFRGTLELCGPSGTTIIKQELRAKIESLHRRLRLKVNMGIPIQESGLYKFKVSGSDSEQMSAETDVQVNFHLDKKAV